MQKNLYFFLSSGFKRRVVLLGLSLLYGKGSADREEHNSRGITLIELLIVVSIIAILTAGIGFSYADWMGRYRVEKTTKELYVDLMNLRARAMTRNCAYFADFNFPAPADGQGTYRMAEDTNDDNEGDDNADGVIDSAGQTFIASSPKTVECSLTNNFTGKIINFDRRGIVQPRGQALGGTICFFSDNDPDYDCIVISRTRIIMGKLKKQPGDGGECNSTNCVKK